MLRHFRRLHCWVLLLTSVAASAQDTPLDRQRIEGARLAMELRTQKPAENLTNTGTLRLRDARGRRRETPVTVITSVNADGWRVRYSALAGATGALETLVVTFNPERPPEYQLGIGNQEPAPLASTEAVRPFAGTDFSVADLGLEFLHWPDQRIAKQELSNGRLCWALDSYNPGTNGYASVRSWVDSEFHALLRAEAYDARRRKVKEFSTGSFRQVTTRTGEEVWMLKDIRIRDEARDSRTELLYDLPKP